MKVDNVWFQYFVLTIVKLLIYSFGAKLFAMFVQE